MIIEIKGVQFINKGAELMLCAITQRIRENWPDAEIALAPNNNSPYLRRIKVGAWQKVSLRKYPLDFNQLSYNFPTFIKDYLRKWGVITESDVDVVLDASGFAYGDQWNSVILQHALAEAKRCKRNGKKYIFLPQAFGPFENEKHKKLIQENMHHASLVCAREEQSYQNLCSLMDDSSNVKMFPDFTNALVAELPDYIDKYQNRVCLIPNHNMIGSRNPNKGWHSSYIELFTVAIEKCRKEGIEPFILNHEGHEDLAVCSKINAQLDKRVEVITEVDPIKVKGIIQASKAIVCSRFHGCVSALSQAIPCIGTSWSHKYEQLFSEYGISEFLVSDNWSENEVIRLLDEALTRDEKLMNRLDINSQKYKTITENMWQVIKETING